MLRVILPLALLLMLALGGGALFLVYDYVNNQNTDMAGVVRGDADASELNPGATALRMVAEGMAGANTTQPRIDLRGLLPEAPEGWFRTGYTTQEGEGVVEAEIIRSMVFKSDTNSLLLELEKAAAAGRYGEVAVYIRGPRRMIVMMRVPEQLNENSVQGGLMAEVANTLNSMNLGFGEQEEEEQPFARVDGIAVEEQPRVNYVMRSQSKVPVDYRIFEMDIAGTIAIKIITNGSDQDVADVLAKFDMEAINAKFGPGQSGILVGGGIQTADATLATDPPGPGPMHRAYALVQAGAAGNDREGDILEAIAEARIADWEDVADKYGRGNYYMTPTLESVLGKEPHELLFSRLAQVLLQREGQNGYLVSTEMRALRNIKDGRYTTQADALDLKRDGEEWHPGTLELIAMMPRGALEEATAAVAVPTEPGVRPSVNRGLGRDSSFANSGNCTLEFGVRRCSLAETGGE